MERVTKKQAMKALDNLDDYARMDVGVNAYGPRGVLEQFIRQQEDQLTLVDQIKRVFGFLR